MIPAIINYAENIWRAIREDDLIIMRRYENSECYLESFESAARQIRMPENRQKINGGLTECSYEDVEEYGDDEEIYDDECSETEQSESEPEENLQLRLF